MKCLHIVQLNERNGYELFHQMRERFDLSEHTFFVCNTREKMKMHFPKFEEFSEFSYFDDDASNFTRAVQFYRMIRDAEKVVFHSLIFTDFFYLVIIYLLRGMLSKATWIEWGADLYNWRQQGKSIKAAVRNHVNLRIRQHIGRIGYTVELDIEEIRKQFGADIPCFYAPLPFGTNRIEQLEKAKLNADIEKDFVQIQVAHNSLQLNNHIRILRMLERFKDENIRIILPLSYGVFGINGQYGGRQYLNTVVKNAKMLIGKSKVVIMKRSIPLDYYMSYMWGTDIVIFDIQRPIGMATIMYMLYMHKKIFLAGDSVQYRFLKSKKVDVYRTEDIPKMTYEEFIAPASQEDNPWVIESLIPGNGIKKWDALLLDIVGECKLKELTETPIDSQLNS